MKADLHVHSVQSDGSLTRAGILGQAAALGITHLAFSEHDDTRFYPEAEALGRRFGVKVLRAVELSACDPQTGVKAHVLGYLFRSTAAIEAVCAPVLRRRHANCLWQIEVLRGLGYRIEPQDVLPYARGGTLYKQHIYHYLLDSGQSEALFGEVSRRVFRNGGPCDRQIDYPDARQAVAAIRADGGYAVLAHPGQQQNFGLVPALVDAGLAGLELWHPSNSEADRARIRELAARHGLFCTGGSDFHGAYEAGRDRLGAFLAPEDCPLIGTYEALEKEASR